MADSPETLIERIIDTETAIKRLEEQKETLRDELEALCLAGEIDPSFTYNDWSFNRSEGRRSYDYPDTIKQAEADVKALKKASEADGTATLKPLSPSWTIKAPRP
jgi:hypothetical protein